MGATNTLYSCLNTQTALDRLAGEGTPANGNQQTLGITKALTSDQNTKGFEFDISPMKERPTSSSNRKVTVYGRVKNCPTVVTSKPDACTPVSASTSDLIDDEVYVENYNGVQETLARSVYKGSCDIPLLAADMSDLIAQKLRDMAESVLKAENDEHIAAMITDVDDYFDGDASTINGGTEKTVNLYSTAGQPQPGNIFTITEQYRRKGYAGIPPIMVGGATLARWASDLQLYLGNVDGLDISKMPAMLPTWVDYEWDTQAQAVGPNTDNRLVTWIPGQLQRVTYLDYAEGSSERRTSSTATFTTVTIDGEEFDYSIVTPDCGDITITLGRFSDLWIAPSTFFDASCGGQETLLSWITDCVDTTCANIQV